MLSSLSTAGSRLIMALCLALLLVTGCDTVGSTDKDGDDGGDKEAAVVVPPNFHSI